MNKADRHGIEFASALAIAKSATRLAMALGKNEGDARLWAAEQIEALTEVNLDGLIDRPSQVGWRSVEELAEYVNCDEPNAVLQALGLITKENSLTTKGSRYARTHQRSLKALRLWAPQVPDMMREFLEPQEPHTWYPTSVLPGMLGFYSRGHVQSRLRKLGIVDFRGHLTPYGRLFGTTWADADSTKLATSSDGLVWNVERLRKVVGGDDNAKG